MTDPTNSRKLQLEPTVDASAVRPGVEATKQAIGEIGQAGQRAGEVGAAGIQKVGDAASKSAAETARAYGRIEAEIRRVSAQAQAAAEGTGRAGAILNRAIAQGLDPTKLEPGLAKLRELEAAAAKSFGTVQVSAAQTAAALRGVPAQLTDIVTSLQGGQQPLTVFLQQGGQLRDMFGSAGAAAKALGGAVLGLVTPLTVTAALVAGVGLAYLKGADEGLAFQRTLALTGNQAGTTADQLARAAAGIKSFEVTQGAAASAINDLAATGKVGADNLGRFAAAAIRLEQVGGPAVESTVKSFAELGKSPLAASLKLNEATNFLTASVYEQIKSLEQQGRVVEATRVAQEAFATSTEQRIPQLAASVGLLEKAWQGVKRVIGGIGDDLANIGRADTVADLERKLSNAQVRARDAGPAGFLAVLAERNVNTLRDQLAAAREVEALAKRSAQADADRARQLAAITEFDKISEASLDKQAKLKREIERIETIGLAAGKSRAEIEVQVAAARERARDKATDNQAQRALEQEAALLERLSGLSGTYAQDLQRLESSRKRGVLTEQQYVEAVQELIAKQPFAVKLAKDQADAEKQVADAMARGNDLYLKKIAALTQSADAATQQAQKLRDEEEALRLVAAKNVSLAEAIELVIIKRLEDKKVAEAGNPEAVAAIEREIQARRELAQLIGNREARDAAQASAKEASKEWQRASSDIERSLTDALLRGFESGKGFAETFRDTVVNLFKTMVLRPIIQPIMGGMASGIGQIFGLPQMGATGGGGAGALGGLGSVGNVASLLGLQGLGSAFSGGFGLTMSGAGGTGLALQGAGGLFGSGAYGQAFGQAAGALAPWALGAGVGIFGGRAISGGYALGGGSGNTAVNVGTAIGAVIGGPIGAAIGGAIGGLANRAFGRGPREVQEAGLSGSIGGGDFSGQMYEDWLRKGGWFRSDKRGTDFKSIDTELEAGLDVGARAILENTKAWASALALPGEQLASITSSFRTRLTGDAKQDEAAIASILQGYSDALTRGFLEQLAPFQAGGETASQTLERLAGSLSGVNGVLSLLGQSLLTVSTAGGDAASQLLAQFGGLAQFQQVSGQYLLDYYSEAERTAMATQQLAQQFQAIGVAMPSTRDALRDLIEDASKRLDTEAGRNAYAALLQLAGAFAQVVPAITDVGQAAAEAARLAEEAAERQAEAGRRVLADLVAQQDELQVELLRAQGDAAGAAELARQQALAKITEGLSGQDAAAAAAAYDYIASLRDQIEALNAASTAAQQAAAAQQQAAQAEQQRLAGIASEREGLVTRLLQAQGDTAALRERELLALDPSNRELLNRIFRIEDEKAAAEETARAADQAAQAAERLRESWLSITDSIISEVRRIRGLMGGSSAQSFSAAQTQFALVTARARAGDQEAARQLPAVSQALLELARAQIASGLDLKLLRAQVAASLTSTASQLSGRFGFDVPRMATGTNEVPQDMLAVVHRGEAIVPKAYNPALGGGAGRDERLIAEIKGLREDQRVQAAAIVRVQSDLFKLNKKWDFNGTPPTRQEGVVA